MNAKPLREIINEATRYHAELDGESDRAAAILAAAYFEERLRDAIMRKFTDINKTLREKIFTGYGPLSTFSAKIDIARALGIYDQKTYNGLHKIKRIRNMFAHASTPIEFNQQDIADLCRNLTPKSPLTSENMRARYIHYLEEVENDIMNEL